MKRVRLIDKNRSLWFECPGCGENHGVTIAGPGVPHPCWKWNGSLEAPTLEPSVLRKGTKSLSEAEVQAYLDTGKLPAPTPYVCHSFIRDGQIEFLSDCTHAMAGKTVPLPGIEGPLRA